MKLRLNILIALTGVLLSSQVLGHGYFTNGRAKLCADGDNQNCGDVVSEPESVSGRGGFPGAGPEDGVIASGGTNQWQELDEQSSNRWTKVNFRPGVNTFQWKLTTSHSTSDWQYFITKQDWDSDQPLSRDAFVLEPFCEVDGSNQTPPNDIEHACTVPSRSGYQVILAAWNIAGEDTAYYQVIDALFDSPPSQGELNISSVSVDESDGAANVAVTLSGNPSNPVNVSISTVEDSALQSTDYYGLFQVLEFDPGEQTINVPVLLIDDQSAEPDEQFYVRLFNADGAIIANDKATITISDTDQGSALFSIMADDVVEGDMLNVSVKLSQAQTQITSVDISSAPVSANRGIDFYGIYATLTFDPGETEKTISIETLDDTEMEQSETLRLRLFSPRGADIETETIDVSIIDDD